MPGKSLETRVNEAVAAAVKAQTPRVPAENLFVRVGGVFRPGRDEVPALVVCSTPAQGHERKKLLRTARVELTFYTTAILVDAADAALTVAKQDAADPDWRAGWPVRVAQAVAGHPLGGVPESIRVFADSAAGLDMSQYEQSNLWWSAVTFRTLCRI